MEVRSYRKVFDLERRIYRVDRLRLNPGGIPVRGVLYFIAILSGALLAGSLPFLGSLTAVLPWYLWDLALPAVSAAVLTLIRIEGRPFHLAAWALLRFAGGPRHLAGARPCAPPGRRWCPAEILMLPDGSDARLRDLRYTGPGAVLVLTAHERTEWRTGVMGTLRRRLPFEGSQLTLRELPGRCPPGRGGVIALRPGARLQVCSTLLTARPGERAKGV